MGCRKALLQLHRAGIIELPAVTKTFAFQKQTRAVAPPPISPVDGGPDELGKIELVRVVREAPDLPCGVYFTPDEWKALTTFVHKIKAPPAEPPTLNEAVALLGRLGGHPGRAGDAPPGSDVLWRGMTRLADISEAYRLYH
jgi:hypothetical protein